MSYADMVTLLMAFFLAMLSVSTVDPALFEQMKKGLRTDVGKDKEVKTPLGEIKHDLDSLLALMPDSHKYAPLLTYPPVREDVALVVDATLPAASVEAGWGLATSGGGTARPLSLS